MSDIAAVVPMRHRSERVPGKNYRLLGDRPLFAHIIDTLLTCSPLNQIFIDTDSPEIQRLSRERYGSSVTLLDRPDHLAGGHVSMNDVLSHDIDRIRADVYLQTHSTNPFLKKGTIERAITAFSNQSGHDALFGVTRVQTRMYWPSARPINHNPQELIRTQDLEPVFEENSSLYLFGRDTLQKTGRRTGRHPMMFEIPRDEAWDIDDESDFAIAECLWNADQEPS